MKEGCTLLHCATGVSRSAALCLSYLMKYQAMSLLDAHTWANPSSDPTVAFGSSSSTMSSSYLARTRCTWSLPQWEWSQTSMKRRFAWWFPCESPCQAPRWSHQYRSVVYPIPRSELEHSTFVDTRTNQIMPLKKNKKRKVLQLLTL